MKLIDILEKALGTTRPATGAQLKGPVWPGRPSPRSYVVAACGMAVPTRLAKRHGSDCDHG